MLVMKSKEALSYKFLVRELSSVLPSTYGDNEVQDLQNQLKRSEKNLYVPSKKIKIKQKSKVISEGLDDEELKVKPAKKW